MRIKERIELFLEKVDWTKMIDSWFPQIADEIKNDFIKNINKNLESIKIHWEANQDLRIGQLLVNKGIIPNMPGMWYYSEEDEILTEQGYELKDVLFWGKNFDKDMNRLPETEWILIKDMTTGHIEAVLAGEFTKNLRYLKAFKDELKLRKK